MPSTLAAAAAEESSPSPKVGAPLRCSRRYERVAEKQGACRVAGVDEVGRGALFGPVVAAAVILDPARPIRGLNDSKQLTAPERERLDILIRQRALAWAVVGVDAGEIDFRNIYQASRLAMHRAVEQLRPEADYLLVDAVRLDWQGPQRALIHGDALSHSIAAASIVAKVYRDALMRRWAAVFPAYDLASNKGYGAPRHLAALERFGASPLHRMSFAPVWERRIGAD
ncbi:MAG: ribonuclease HII [Terriglobales bacterium]